ncbi:MAG TPA: ParB/RepB/Spo0J family partition protein [Streptosporangiaceae bacterium]|nr:ParB/RepB/Spo0J family partition protein [Streptosporangiaceae bacterium]
MPIQDTAVPVKELARSDTRAATLPLGQQLDSAPVVTVAIGSLRMAASPRLAGESLEHARLLADSDAVLPPIIVHRETRRVIDGMHRVRAAVLRGEQRIQARFYDGTEEDAFVLAVRINSAQGLPLSLSDRKAAAARILASHPHWSDRAIAEVTALSHKTVGAIRRRPDGEYLQVDVRIGQNGRVRPLDAAAGRRRAAELLTARPGASLRQVAAAAGISPETVRDVRARLLHGIDPLPPRQRRDERGADTRLPVHSRETTSQALTCTTGNLAVIVRKLSRDPALRSSQTTVGLIRLLAVHPSDPAQWRQLAVAVPRRWAAPVAAAATECARAWHIFAGELDQRAKAWQEEP